jgi:hypothetical protein
MQFHDFSAVCDWLNQEALYIDLLTDCYVNCLLIKKYLPFNNQNYCNNIS